MCAPYNADFDGDEMNVHVPQTEEARAEAALLMGVEHNLATPKNGEILIAATQARAPRTLHSQGVCSSLQALRSLPVLGTAHLRPKAYARPAMQPRESWAGCSSTITLPACIQGSEFHAPEVCIILKVVCVQDFLTSAFLVTGRDCFYTREAAAELVAAMCDALGSVDLPQPALLKPLQLWTGKQLMSALIRPSSRMQCAHTPCHPPAPGHELLLVHQAVRLLWLEANTVGACSAPGGWQAYHA